MAETGQIPKQPLLAFVKNYLLGEREADSRFATWKERAASSASVMRQIQKHAELEVDEIGHYTKLIQSLEETEIKRREASVLGKRSKVVRLDYTYQMQALNLSATATQTKTKYINQDPTATMPAVVTETRLAAQAIWHEDFSRWILPSATYDHDTSESRKYSVSRTTDEQTKGQIDILRWLEEVDTSKSIYWALGDVESGRTAMLRGLAYHLGRLRRGGLGPCFFFPEPTPDLEGKVVDTRTYFIATITYGIIERDPHFKKSFGSLYNTFDSRITSKIILKQVQELILRPYAARPQSQPLLFIIDGLEHVASHSGVYILDALEAISKELSVCFVLGSSEKQWIRARMESNLGLGPKVFNCHEKKGILTL